MAEVPSDVVRPSPQFMDALRIGLPVVPGAVIVTVTVTGWPTAGFAGDGALSVIDGPVFTVTVMSLVCAVPPVLPVPPVTPMPAVAVTFAVRVVVKVVVATPLLFVAELDGLTAPVSLTNDTATPGSRLPLMSRTVAEIVDDPPEADRTDGLAFNDILPTAAVPTAIFRAFAALTDAPPDEAVIVAVPLAFPALNVTIARPLISVSASDGSIVPSVVVKMMCVPVCGGVPAGSSTCAISCAVPPVGTAVAAAVSVMVDPPGASNGTRSQAPAAIVSRSEQ